MSRIAHSSATCAAASEPCSSSSTNFLSHSITVLMNSSDFRGAVMSCVCRASITSGSLRRLGRHAGTPATGMCSQCLCFCLTLAVTVAVDRVGAAKLKPLSYHHKSPKVKVEGWLAVGMDPLICTPIGPIPWACRRCRDHSEPVGKQHMHQYKAS